MTLESLGRHEEALEMARRRLDRYPDGIYDRAELAELLWMQQRFEEVPRVLLDPGHPPAPWDWARVIGPCFRDAFRDRPLAKMQDAFAVLIAAGVNPWYLAEIPSTMAKADRPDAAFTLLTMITAKNGGIGPVDPRFNAYRYLKAWKGEEAAIAWVRSAVPPQSRMQALDATLDEGLLDLFWRIDDPPSEQADIDRVKLVRVRALALAPDKGEEHRSELWSYFSGRKTSKAEYALYLLDATPKSAFLKLAADPSRRSAVAYYLGLKAMGQENYEEASEWLLISLETGGPPDARGEFQDAKTILHRWAREGRSFERMKVERLF
jgi:hypothetical protein